MGNYCEYSRMVKALIFKHTSAWVADVDRTVWICHIISSQACAAVVSNSIGAVCIWTTHFRNLSTFIHILIKESDKTNTNLNIVY